MVPFDNISEKMPEKRELIELVEERMPQTRIDELYRLSEEWATTALGQTMKNKTKNTSIPSLVDKLSSEVIEAEGAIRYYAASSKKDKYREECVKEVCDVGNMALILMPIIFETPQPQDFPDYEEMLKSIAYHESRYGFEWVVPFDLSQQYPHRDLFKIYMRVVDSMILQQTQRSGNRQDSEKSFVDQFHLNYIMLHKDLDEFLEQDNFAYMHPHINMTSKWVRMTGDMITHSLILLGEVSGTYEQYFQLATQKMQMRDRRYHEFLTRYDERR